MPGPPGWRRQSTGRRKACIRYLIDKETPGRARPGTSSRIENYLGFPKGLSGGDLARRATAQASRLGAEILTAQEVVSIGVKDSYKVVTLADGSEIACRALVVATGVSVRELDVPGATGVTGAGVYYGAAVSEAAHYRGENVFVVGGANSAGQGAVFLSQYAKKVTMLVRSSLAKSMSQYLIEQIESCDNIDVWLGKEIVEVHGDERLEALTIRDRETGETQKRTGGGNFYFHWCVTAYTQMLGDLVAFQSRRVHSDRAGPLLEWRATEGLDAEARPVPDGNERAGNICCRRRSPRRYPPRCVGRRTGIDDDKLCSRVSEDRLIERKY